METNDYADENFLLQKLKKRDIQAFAKFYKDYSEDLLILAYTLLGNAPQSIQKVDELFMDLWEQNKFEKITLPIHNYLYSELRKTCKPAVYSNN